MSGDNSEFRAGEKAVTPFESLRIDRTAFSVVRLGDESTDREYWWERTHIQRLEALEFMRQVAFGYDPATARLQKFSRLLNSLQVVDDIDGIRVSLINLEHLKLNKRASGRLKDLADLDYLP